tara:strand:- start:625 stop:864 length:240 start_codon:yes stop_codon:yes gene_type:complete
MKVFLLCEDRIPGSPPQAGTEPSVNFGKERDLQAGYRQWMPMQTQHGVINARVCRHRQHFNAFINRRHNKDTAFERCLI